MLGVQEGVLAALVPCSRRETNPPVRSPRLATMGQPFAPPAVSVQMSEKWKDEVSLEGVDEEG